MSEKIRDKLEEHDRRFRTAFERVKLTKPAEHIVEKALEESNEGVGLFLKGMRGVAHAMGTFSSTEDRQASIDAVVEYLRMLRVGIVDAIDTTIDSTLKGEYHDDENGSWCKKLIDAGDSLRGLPPAERAKKMKEMIGENVKDPKRLKDLCDFIDKLHSADTMLGDPELLAKIIGGGKLTIKDLVAAVKKTLPKDLLERVKAKEKELTEQKEPEGPALSEDNDLPWVESEKQDG